MSVLLLVRHGQASWGSADYDVLSDLGHEQSRLLGKHLAVGRVGYGEIDAAGGATAAADAVERTLP